MRNGNKPEKCVGKYEKAAPGTPDDYVNLYEKCWIHEPEQRPNIKEVLKVLKDLSKTMGFENCINEGIVPKAVNNYSQKNTLESLMVK
ncbi:6853_t:CDS:2 [Funneliformis geosporum]|uniref:6853_t:CDS:1 n=1 Tax=Funneliformis geosporum TaxID=1117311 RepID=A0A9W4SBC1_9GLOM|nr:6853_t:CDS:2 [Funneliformis geosporum]